MTPRSRLGLIAALFLGMIAVHPPDAEAGKRDKKERAKSSSAKSSRSAKKSSRSSQSSRSANSNSSGFLSAAAPRGGGKSKGQSDGGGSSSGGSQSSRGNSGRSSGSSSGGSNSSGPSNSGGSSNSGRSSGGSSKAGGSSSSGRNSGGSGGSSSSGNSGSIGRSSPFTSGGSSSGSSRSTPPSIPSSGPSYSGSGRSTSSPGTSSGRNSSSPFSSSPRSSSGSGSNDSGSNRGSSITPSSLGAPISSSRFTPSNSGQRSTPPSPFTPSTGSTSGRGSSFGSTSGRGSSFGSTSGRGSNLGSTNGSGSTFGGSKSGSTRGSSERGTALGNAIDARDFGRKQPSTFSPGSSNRAVSTPTKSLNDAYKNGLRPSPFASKGTKLDAGSPRRFKNGGNQTGSSPSLAGDFKSPYKTEKSKSGTSKYKYKYKYKYQSKYKYGGYPYAYDCSFWKINVHPFIPFSYYPAKYGWYTAFGYHPVWSSYWWCEWWPSYSVYPKYVYAYPTYQPVYENTTVIYYPVDETPDYVSAQPAPVSVGPESFPATAIDPALERELAAISANPDAVALLETGANLFREGRFAESADAFRKAMLAEKDNAVPKFALAHSLFALGEYSYAGFLIRRGIEILPNWPSVGTDLRDLYGDPDLLLEHNIALRIYRDSHESDLDALLLAGYVAFFSGDLEVSENDFGTLAEINPTDAVANTFLARIAEIHTLLEAEGIERPEFAPPTEAGTPPTTATPTNDG